MAVIGSNWFQNGHWFGHFRPWRLLAHFCLIFEFRKMAAFERKGRFRVEIPNFVGFFIRHTCNLFWFVSGASSWSVSIIDCLVCISDKRIDASVHNWCTIVNEFFVHDALDEIFSDVVQGVFDISEVQGGNFLWSPLEGEATEVVIGLVRIKTNQNSVWLCIVEFIPESEFAIDVGFVASGTVERLHLVLAVLFWSTESSQSVVVDAIINVDFVKGAPVVPFDIKVIDEFQRNFPISWDIDFPETWSAILIVVRSESDVSEWLLLRSRISSQIFVREKWNFQT